MKKQLILLAMMLLPMLASADPIEIDGIYYNLNSEFKVAEVTHKPKGYHGSIVIPETVSNEGIEYSVTSIGDSAFDYCTGLTSVTIPNSVTSIGNKAFYFCFDLTSVNIPNSVTSIGNEAFYWCWVLTSVNIPNSVTSIGREAFWGCYGLTSVTIPDKVTSIEKNVFECCFDLTSVNIPNTVTSISDWAFSSCRSLPSITIPNSVTSIGREAFSNCAGLKSVTIPNSVTSIDREAFNICSAMASVTIGKGIEFISSSAFASCKKLTDVYCFAENVPNTSIDAFKDSPIDYATLYVPAASIQAYKTKEPWKNFASIESIPDEYVNLKQCKKPSIRYSNGQLSFTSETGGAKFITDITNSDIKRHNNTNIQLTATYTISVYAIKPGYENSDVVTGTLCWIDAEPKTEGITDNIVNISTKAVLIQADGGIINVQGTDDGTPVSVYGVNGSHAGSAISQNGAATINTTLPSGSVAIVKVGEKSIKVIVK